MLSSQFIAHYAPKEDRFVQSQQGRDQQEGTVRVCTIVGRDYGMSLWNTGAVFRVTGTLIDGHDHDQYTDTGTMEVVNDHGWKISSEGIDDILYLAG